MRFNDVAGDHQRKPSASAALYDSLTADVTADPLQSPAPFIDDATRAELYRARHRQYVRKSYYKNKNTLTQLRDEHARLDSKMKKLVIETKAELSATKPNKLWELRQKLIDAFEVRERICEENRQLYMVNSEMMKIESHIQQLVDSEVMEAKVIGRFTYKKRDWNYLDGKMAPHAADVVYKPRDFDEDEAINFGDWTVVPRSLKPEESVDFRMSINYPRRDAHRFTDQIWSVLSDCNKFKTILPRSLHPEMYELQRNERGDSIVIYRELRPDHENVVLRTIFISSKFRNEDGSYLLYFHDLHPDIFNFQAAEDDGLEVKWKPMNIYVKIIPYQDSHGNFGSRFEFYGKLDSKTWRVDFIQVAFQLISLCSGPALAWHQE